MTSKSNHIIRINYRISGRNDHLGLEFPYPNRELGRTIEADNGLFLSVDKREQPLSYDISEVRTPYTTGERKQLVTSYIGETIMSVLDESAWQGRFTDRIPVSYYEYMDMLDACAQAVENESVDIDPSLKTLLDIY